ncbi:MAG: ABC-2 transporter permease [Oscillospiraceae bacterium]|nr:ABC-2 transporter permease [Oscillospiraceae bacterium]
MKGLLYKELVTQKLAIHMLAAATFFYGFAGNILFALEISLDETQSVSDVRGMCMVAAFAVFFIFSMVIPEFFKKDEKGSWSSFAISSPQGAKGQIQSKYIIILIINLAILFTLFVADCIIVAIVGDMAASNLTIYMIIFCSMLAINAVEMPFYVRFGSSKGGNVKAAIISVVIIALMIYALFGDLTIFTGENPIESIYNFFVEGKTIWIVALLPFVAIVLYVASYNISLRLYQKGVESYEE